MSSRARIGGLILVGLIAFLTPSFPLTAYADEAAAQLAPQQVRPIRQLGGSTRFTPPVNTVGALQKMFSQPRIQTDVRAVLEMDNLGANSAEVNRILSSGMVMETTVPNGTTFLWMALRRGGRPEISRNLRWDGAKPLEGYQFVIDNLTETLTFFVPKICGNLSLISREPSREAARRAEEARKAEAAKAAAAAAAADAARKAEEAGKRQKRRKRQRHARRRRSPPGRRRSARLTRNGRLPRLVAPKKRARRPNRIVWPRKTKH